MAEEPKRQEQQNSRDFSEDIYSASSIEKAPSLSVKTGDSPKAGGYWGGVEPLPPTAYQQEEFREEPLPDLPHTAAPARPRQHAQRPIQAAADKALNGISWKKQRRKNRRDIITLNNGEPLSFALRKITVELVVVLVCLLVVGGFFFAKGFVLDKLTDDSVSPMATGTRYAAPLGVEVAPAAAQDSPGYACIAMVGNWAGTPVDSSLLRAEYEGRDITNLADGMEKELARAIPNKTVTRKENLSNYTLLTQIYDSLKDGAPVIVSCTAPDGETMTWAVVTGMHAREDQISLVYSDGTAAALTLEDFLSSVRYESLTGMHLGTRMALAIGIYNKNTAFFFTPVEE